ncbi:MAG TPA: glycosyltransferase family 9 protein [Thermomicrobiales bacterium]|jgi:ADP-heptose:LPS heptosyltransferase|nr:glycosyltransferase family 9 protein [Thermomicrobiales bacterium]
MIDAAWRDARNVLLIRLDNLGDVLVTTPAMRAVRVGLPAARLTLLASPVGAQAGRLDPDLDDVLVYEAPWMDPWRQLPHDPAREAAAIAEIAGRRFDGAIIFTSFRQSSLPAAYLCYLAGIPLRAAASLDGPGSLLTTRHKHPARMMHEVERGLDLVGALGFPTEPTPLVLRVPEAARAEIGDFIDAGAERPLVVIHPGCSMPARTYSWEGFAAVAGLLVERFGARVFVTGSAAESALVERVVDAISPLARDSVHPAAGVLSFAGLSALIKRADLVVTNNTGPMHIAAAVQTPVVALFALTNPPEQWGPWRVPHRLLNHDVPCRLCYSRVCPTTHDCLRLVTPEDVLTAAGELLSEHRAAGLALAGAGAGS